MDMDNLERQVHEMEALRSMYPEDDSDGCLILADAERQALAAAQALLDQALAQQSAAAAPSVNLSGSVRLPGALLAGAPVVLHFQLPVGYPSAATPSLLVECTAPRLLHEQLTAAVNRAAEEAVGSEALLLVLGTLQEDVASACSTAAASRDHQLEAKRAGGGDSSNACPHCQLRVVVWFHHIKSTIKRKLILSWARDLGLRGAVKPGFPGVLVAEGATQQVREYVARIRGLKWQAMQTRGEEELKCSECAAQQQQQKAEQPDDAAAAGPGFSDCFVELPESGGMSELSKLCAAAGLEQLFLAALKLK